MRWCGVGPSRWSATTRSRCRSRGWSPSDSRGTSRRAARYSDRVSPWRRSTPWRWNRSGHRRRRWSGPGSPAAATPGRRHQDDLGPLGERCRARRIAMKVAGRMLKRSISSTVASATANCTMPEATMASRRPRGPRPPAAGIVDQLQEPALGHGAVDDGDGGDHRTGEGPAAGFVDAGDLSLATQFEAKARQMRSYAARTSMASRRPSFSSVTVRSYRVWRFIQNCADVPNRRPRRSAVSAVMPRLLLIMSVMRPEGTPSSRASLLALNLRATISRRNRRPGCTATGISIPYGSRRFQP